jgi:single-stranded-DNA-specific exonuclease
MFESPESPNFPGSERRAPGSIPQQRWQIPDPTPSLAAKIAQEFGLPPLLAQALINRGLVTLEQVAGFINPESLTLNSPLTEFKDLALSVELLQQAIAHQQKIAICGDYDADGMTSTALLLRSLRAMSAQVDYAIPSRMQEGYGINQRIVEELQAEGVQLILTVDNGICAHQPIQRARELGMTVIITDHHDLPPELPPAHAILNPKLLPPSSAYAGLAGVGVAYVLAVCLAQRLGKTQELISPLLELYTLGTIADLAALTGVNRRWLKRGLKLLPRSEYVGIQALIQVSGESASHSAALKPDAIGFRLAPRINAVGRIGDPQIVIDLLTTDDPILAHQRARQCEQTNRERQQLCEQIELEAIAWIEQSQLDLIQERVLVVVQPDWHHGVIGIVASRLVERYGLPVFIGSWEEKGQIRGSARGIPEFDIFAALQFCQDILEKFGGHRAAGGFSLQDQNLAALRSRLSQFGHLHLRSQDLKPLVSVDAVANFAQITPELYRQIDQLQPWGIGNPEPIFYSTQVQVTQQRAIGKEGLHLKMTLTQTEPDPPHRCLSFKALAWRWGEYYPLPETLDVAYRLRENTWQGETNLELEVVGVRWATDPAPTDPAPVPIAVQVTAGAKPELGIRVSPGTPMEWICPQPPPISTRCQWLSLDPPLGPEVSTLLPGLGGRILVYGDQRPYLSIKATPAHLDYDRPQSRCNIFLLWNLPPSWTHLRWLIARGQPEQIYVRNALPDFPTALDLRHRLQFFLSRSPSQPLNLLALGQQFWVAPSTLVASLRELGYNCKNFPQTVSLEEELQRLKRWYLLLPSELQKL